MSDTIQRIYDKVSGCSDIRAPHLPEPLLQAASTILPTGLDPTVPIRDEEMSDTIQRVSGCSDIRDEEARYLVIQLVKKYPGLADLLFKLQGEGTGWVPLLQVLEQAVADGGGDHADHSKGTSFIRLSVYPRSFSLKLLGYQV